MQLIDFGKSSTDRALPEIEITQFMRTLDMADGGAGVTKQNQAFLWPRLLEYYQTKFDSDVSTRKTIEDIYFALMDDTEVM